MRIKVEWERTQRGVSEIEVPEAEVAAWLNESWNRGIDHEDRTPESITPQEAFDWLQSGEDEVWAEQIDFDRDEKPFPWGDDVELERLHRER